MVESAIEEEPDNLPRLAPSIATHAHTFIWPSVLSGPPPQHSAAQGSTIRTTSSQASTFQLSKHDVTRRRASDLISPSPRTTHAPPPLFAPSPAIHYPLRHARLPMASEKRARAPSMDDHMEQDSPPPEDTPSSNQHDSGATPASTTQNTGASTASASNPSAGTPATAGTTQTADTSSSAGTPNAPPAPSLSSTTASKRRRGLGVVTPNACTECRKKRAKVLLHCSLLCSRSRPSRTFLFAAIRLRMLSRPP